MIASLSRGSLLDEVLHGSFNEQQLAAYVSWVNSQLKRKPGLKPITDLRHDLQDGVVLTQLIEIVAGEVLEGVYVAPQNKEESRKNVEQVLQFISSRHIRMPHISARDIVDGNLKSVMRIILALAAHFKPTANHRAAAAGGRSLTRGHASHNPLSTVALAQGAAAALASARYDASQPARVARIHSGWGLNAEKSVCVRALVEQYERGAPDEQDDPQPSSNKSSVCVHAAQLIPMLWRRHGRISLNETLEKEVRHVNVVSALQALLLHGSLPEDEQMCLTLTSATLEQQLLPVSLGSEYGGGLELKKEVGQKDRVLQQLKHKLKKAKTAAAGQEERRAVFWTVGGHSEGLSSGLPCSRALLGQLCARLRSVPGTGCGGGFTVSGVRRVWARFPATERLCYGIPR
ncbi:dixin isoform X1 [Lates japonicus]|uniref:Dixin isoform X1 n=1 Tax=Lates japonicus TaxID=270547 RepID=A0AAD3NGN2_LATJO|nr:dixin isoform X1 [Lates japonicus]